MYQLRNLSKKTPVNTIGEFNATDIGRIRDTFFDFASEGRDIFVLSLLAQWFKSGESSDAIE